MYYCSNWRLALSEAALPYGFLFLRHIPPPTTAVYKDFSATFSQSDGGQVQHGYAHVTLRWEALLPADAWFIKNYVDNTLNASGQLYLTISKNNAEGIGRHWIDVRGRPHPLDVVEGGAIPGAIGMFYENVTLFVNNLTIINDPAIF